MQGPRQIHADHIPTIFLEFLVLGCLINSLYMDTPGAQRATSHTFGGLPVHSPGAQQRNERGNFWKSYGPWSKLPSSFIKGLPGCFEGAVTMVQMGAALQDEATTLFVVAMLCCSHSARRLNMHIRHAYREAKILLRLMRSKARMLPIAALLRIPPECYPTAKTDQSSLS